MNANYVRIKDLPDYDHYGRMLEVVQGGDYFISMGQVLLPDVKISTESASTIKATAQVQWTFPLAYAMIVWGDGEKTFTEKIDLTETRPYGDSTFEWSATANNWKWARLEVWDIAGNGALINPVRR